MPLDSFDDRSNNKLDPLVSVVMSAYNSEKYIVEAIESILNQTYKNFEFIIIDDGSRDKTTKIIKRYAKMDSRIEFKSRPNKGLIRSLNEGLRMSKGSLVARQDADDVSKKLRLQKQVDFLNKNPSVALVGTNYVATDEKGNVITTTDVLTTPDDLKLAEIFSNQFGHGTIMVRAEVLREVGFYDTCYKHAEDYDLWSRMSRSYLVANLKEPLYIWRSHPKNVTSKYSREMKKQILVIRQREFDCFRKNRRHYKLLAFHPSSIRGSSIKYAQKKNILFRNISLMYCYSGQRLRSLPYLFIGVLYAPWNRKTYYQILIVLLYKSKIRNIPYQNI